MDKVNINCETIDLNEMSHEELKKVVKFLWNQVQSLSNRIDMLTTRQYFC